MLSPPEVGYDLTLYAQVWLEERLRLTRALARAVSEKPSPKRVHDVRVACRRLREAIEFFRGVPEVPPLSDVDRAARALARSVRQLRELDVARKRLSQLQLPSSARAGARTQEKLGKALKKRRRQAQEKHLDRIRKRAADFETAVRDILPLYDKPRAIEPDRTRESHLMAFVEARVAEKRALVETLFDGLRPKGRSAHVGAKGAQADRLHTVRVAVKHWRYASEIGRAVMPRVLYRPMVTRLRSLQEIGGKGQDLVDLERIAGDELERLGVSTRARRPLLSTIRASQRAAAGHFLTALGSRLPAVQAVSAG
ncbi:MAG TPA: CHAD domain-containing protein [Polyangiaceae bacterium]|nr:CHAD domain-containing protein [Polyangiaceae bacterium]